MNMLVNGRIVTVEGMPPNSDAPLRVTKAQYEAVQILARAGIGHLDQIRVVRNLTDFNLRDSKDLVDLVRECERELNLQRECWNSVSSPPA